MTTSSKQGAGVIISRNTRGETVNGKPRADRVSITGPHFGPGIFSSTDDRAEATRFTRADAEALVERHWQGHMPQIEQP